jgi:hypothetical protein
LCDAHSLCTRVRPASARGSDAIAFSLTSTTFAASPSSQTYSGERGEARVSLGHDARLPRRLRALQRAVRPVVVAPELIHGHGDVPAQLLEALLDLREERVHGTRSTARGRDTSTTPRATSSDDAQIREREFSTRVLATPFRASLDSKIRQNATRFGVSSDGSIDPRGTAIRPAKLTGDSTQGITVRRFRSRNRTRDRIDDLFFWALTVSHSIAHATICREPSRRAREKAKSALSPNPVQDAHSAERPAHATVERPHERGLRLLLVGESAGVLPRGLRAAVPGVRRTGVSRDVPNSASRRPESSAVRRALRARSESRARVLTRPRVADALSGGTNAPRPSISRARASSRRAAARARGRDVCRARARLLTPTRR